MTYAERMRGRRILMLNASHDEVIPRSCTDALWESLGKPRIVWWDAGHIAITFLFDGIAETVKFFTADDLQPAGTSADETKPASAVKSGP